MRLWKKEGVLFHWIVLFAVLSLGQLACSSSIDGGADEELPGEQGAVVGDEAAEDETLDPGEGLPTLPGDKACLTK